MSRIFFGCLAKCPVFFADCAGIAGLFAVPIVVVQGARCERCRALYVGSPAHGHACLPCWRVCHQHTELCLSTGQLHYDLSLQLANLTAATVSTLALSSVRNENVPTQLAHCYC